MDKAKFWEKQYRRGHGRIVGICYRYVNDWTVAQDLAQDVFLKAMETFKAYRAFGRFDAWLTRIAVNHCIDYLRQKPDFIALESEPAAERPDEDTEPIWTADFTEKELLETVQQLPEQQRTVFNLYAIEGYSHRRIAGLLDISVAYSKQLHHRARVRLGQMLTDKYKQKENKRKGLLMIPLLFILKRTNADSRRLDRLYRSKLSGLRPPVGPVVPFQIVGIADGIRRRNRPNGGHLPGQIRHRHRGAQGHPTPCHGRGRHGRRRRLAGGPSPPRRPEPGQ